MDILTRVIPASDTSNLAEWRGQFGGERCLAMFLGRVTDLITALCLDTCIFSLRALIYDVEGGGNETIARCRHHLPRNVSWSICESPLQKDPR